MSTAPDPETRDDSSDTIARNVDAAIAHSGLARLPSLAAIIDRVAELRGKPIQLEQVGDTEWGALTGLWVETRDRSRIFVRRTDPVAYQVVCALHEVMHILLNHPSCLPASAEQNGSLPGVQRRRTVGSPRTHSAQAGYEDEAEYGARVLAQSLLRGVEDPVERRFG